MLHFRFLGESNLMLTLFAYAIPGYVWPYFAGFAILVIGLPVAMRNASNDVEPMDKLLRFGPLSFAVAMAIFGADHFVFAKFVASIVPHWMPWHVFWTYFVGIALISAAVSLASDKLAGVAAGCLGVMIFLFVVMMHLPACLAVPSDRTRITLLLRDLALSSGACAFAASRAEQWRLRGTHAVIAASRFIIAITLIIFGVNHFLYPNVAPGIPQDGLDFAVTMPAWIPAHVFWAYVTGAIFVICGLAILTGKQARPAAIAVAITVLVLTVFVYLPDTIAKASDISEGLNYLAIHLALAGEVLFLASALPKPIPESVKVAVTEA